ncbi:hypothetical protein ACM66B_000355 [Microbotryomycetes sp. NB124-2]
MWTGVVGGVAALFSCLTIAVLGTYLVPNLTTLKSFAEGLTFDNAFDQIKTATGLIVAGCILTIILLILIALSFCCCKDSRVGSMVLGGVILVLGAGNIIVLVVAFQGVKAGELLCEGVSQKIDAVSCGAVTWKLIFGALFGIAAVSQAGLGLLHLLSACRSDSGSGDMSSMSHRRGRTNKTQRSRFLAGYDRGRRDQDEEDLLEEKKAGYRDEYDESRGRSRSRRNSMAAEDYYDRV